MDYFLLHDNFSPLYFSASRMESSSLPGRVQCTKETAVLIQQQQPLIQVEHRGKMEIKGRGQLETYFLNGSDFKSMRPSSFRNKRQPRHSMGDIQIGDNESKLLSHLSMEPPVVEIPQGSEDEEQGAPPQSGVHSTEK